MIGLAAPAQCLFTLRRLTGVLTEPPRSSIRSLAIKGGMNTYWKVGPWQRHRNWNSSLRFQRRETPPPNCRWRWDVESHHVPTAGFTPPLDPSVRLNLRRAGLENRGPNLFSLTDAPLLC
ncbi:unnamed protein product [Brassica oleracea]